MHMVFLICVSAYLAVYSSNSQATNTDNYEIILDGGSSGTKLKIYRWRRIFTSSLDDDTSSGFKINIDLIKNQKFKPGIKEQAHHSLSHLYSYFARFLPRAEEVIPKSHHDKTFIYFLATAGLRTLPIVTTERLLDGVETVLRNKSACPFMLPPEGVRVLSGEEEAVYAWVAANYLRGFFWSDKPPSHAVGVLEMGGGSTQIAFLPDHSVYANMFPIQVGGRTYHLYAHSYLFYGSNYIVSRINEYLVALEGDKLKIENPCMLLGDNKTVNIIGKSVHIQGSADVTKCLEIIDIFLKTANKSWCYPKPCAIGRTYQPSVRSTVFYAISSFIYAPKYLGAVDDLGRLNVSRLKTETVKYCKKTLSEASTDLPAAYAATYCTMGLYIHSLLLDAYGFEETTNVIYVNPEIDSVDIDWSLGAMILEIDNRAISTDQCDTSRAARELGVVSATVLTFLSFTQYAILMS